MSLTFSGELFFLAFYFTFTCQQTKKLQVSAGLLLTYFSHNPPKTEQEGASKQTIKKRANCFQMLYSVIFPDSVSCAWLLVGDESLYVVKEHRSSGFEDQAVLRHHFHHPHFQGTEYRKECHIHGHATADLKGHVHRPRCAGRTEWWAEEDALPEDARGAGATLEGARGKGTAQTQTKNRWVMGLSNIVIHLFLWFHNMCCLKRNRDLILGLKSSLNSRLMCDFCRGFLDLWFLNS